MKLIGEHKNSVKSLDRNGQDDGENYPTEIHSLKKKLKRYMEII